VDLVEELKTERVEDLSSGDGCRIGNWVTTATHHPTQQNSTQRVQLSIFLPSPPAVVVSDCEFNTHRATPTRLDSTVRSRRRCVLGFNLHVDVVNGTTPDAASVIHRQKEANNYYRPSK